MKETEKAFLNLLFTALKTGVFPSVRLSNNVLISYLDLNPHEKEYLKQSFKSDYDGISKKKFKENDLIETYETLTAKNIEALKNIIDSMSIEGLRYKAKPFTDFEEKTELQTIFDFYCGKTGQKIGEPAKVYALNDENLVEIDEIVQSIGQDLVRLSVLREVRNKLKFNEFYNPYKKRIVQSPANACSEVYFQLHKNNRPVDGDELKNRVLIDYHFQIYSDHSQREAKKLAKKSVDEWIRRKKLDNESLIS